MWQDFLETFGYNLYGFVRQFNGVTSRKLALSTLNAREQLYVYFNFTLSILMIVFENNPIYSQNLDKISYGQNRAKIVHIF